MCYHTSTEHFAIEIWNEHFLNIFARSFTNDGASNWSKTSFLIKENWTRSFHLLKFSSKTRVKSMSWIGWKHGLWREFGHFLPQIIIWRGVGTKTVVKVSKLSNMFGFWPSTNLTQIIRTIQQRNAPDVESKVNILQNRNLMVLMRWSPPKRQ